MRITNADVRPSELQIRKNGGTGALELNRREIALVFWPHPRFRLGEHYRRVADEVPNRLGRNQPGGIVEHSKKPTVRHVAYDEAAVALPPTIMEKDVRVVFVHAPTEAIVLVVFPDGRARKESLVLQAVGKEQMRVQGLVELPKVADSGEHDFVAHHAVQVVVL